jgi:hypothetical protein
MKSIATLTMIFLPATFVSVSLASTSDNPSRPICRVHDSPLGTKSIFSMTFFNWHPDAGEDVISPYMWIYPVIVVAVTVAVLAVWCIYSKTRKSRPRKVSPV